MKQHSYSFIIVTKGIPMMHAVLIKAISRREAIQKVTKEFPDLVTIAYMEKLPDYNIKQEVN